MKPYVKPELFFESYELSQNVASCRWDMNQIDRNVCFAQYDTVGDNSFHEPTLRLFTESNLNCNVQEEGLKDSGYDYCYFGATNENAKLFNS